MGGKPRVSTSSSLGAVPPGKQRLPAELRQRILPFHRVDLNRVAWWGLQESSPWRQDVLLNTSRGGRERAAVSLRAQRGHWPRCEVTHPRSLRFSCFALRRARAQKRCSPGFPARTSYKSTRTSQGRCAGMSTRPLEFARLHKCFSALLETSDSSKAVGENGCCIQLGTGGSVAYHSSRRAVAWGAVPLDENHLSFILPVCTGSEIQKKKKNSIICPAKTPKASP